MLIKCYGEFSWLPSSAVVGVILPTIIYDASDVGIDCSGFYTPSEQSITVREFDKTLIPSVISHEFMHHLQNINGTLNPVGARLDPNLNYEESIKQYFTTSINEYEALLFEHKFTKSWLNDWWLRKLVA